MAYIEEQNQEEKKEGKILSHRNFRQKKTEIYPNKKKKGFNLGKLFFGSILVLVGFFYFAQNVGWISGAIKVDIFMFWPLLVIFVGLSFINTQGRLTTLIGITITLLIIAVISLSVFNKIVDTNQSSYNAYQENDAKNIPIKVKKERKASFAEVNVNNSYKQLKIEGITDELIEGNFRSDFIELKMESELDGNLQILNLRNKIKWRDFIGRKRSVLNFALNDRIPIVLNIKNKAGDIDINLKDIKASQVNIDMNISDLNLDLAGELAASKIKIDAIASTIDIKIPKMAGILVKVDSGMSSIVGFDEFVKIAEHTYQYNDYEEADKKIEIELKLKASSLEFF